MKKLIDGKLINLTTEEIIQREQDAIQAEQDRLITISKQEQQLANKQSALTKLSALGLTEAEIKSIIGNN
jgi:hypothetical protein